MCRMNRSGAESAGTKGFVEHRVTMSGDLTKTERTMTMKENGRGFRFGRWWRVAAALCLVAVAGPLAGCAYTETMNERRAEGARLQQELNYEQERARQLSR